MIQKTLTAYCDECAQQLPLTSPTLKEAATELPNAGWTIEGKNHYCPNCALQKAQEQSNAGTGE